MINEGHRGRDGLGPKLSSVDSDTLIYSITTLT